MVLLKKTMSLSLEIIEDILSDPFNLRLWTVHRNLYQIDGNCFEAINRKGSISYYKIKVNREQLDLGSLLLFSWWSDDDKIKEFELQLSKINIDKTLIEVVVSDKAESVKLEQLNRLLMIEMSLLENYLIGEKQLFTWEEANFMQNYYNNMTYDRRIS